MSILDTILGTEKTLSEKDIAFDMLKDSKFGVTSLTAAAAEAVNPELRNILRAQLETAVQEHFELSDIAIKKGWYPAFDAPQQQLDKSCEQAKQLTQQEQ